MPQKMGEHLLPSSMYCSSSEYHRETLPHALLLTYHINVSCLSFSNPVLYQGKKKEEEEEEQERKEGKREGVRGRRS